MLGRRFTSSRIRKERRKRFLIQLLLWVILCGALLFLVVEVVHLKQLRIKHVRFEGNKAVPMEELWAFLKPFVEGEYAYIFSKRNIFILPNEKIEAAFLKKFVRLEDIDLYRRGLDTLVVRSTERGPAGLWCGKGAASQICYYLDHNGLAFASAPKLTGGTFIVFARELPEHVIGAYLSDPEDLRILKSFIDSLVSLGFRTERVVWENDAIVLSVRAALAEGTSVPLSLKIPLAPPYDQAYSNLASVLQNGDEENRPLSLEGIDYIDLRFENKVFYKKDNAVISE